MSEYAGEDIVITWVHAGGTLTLSGETRNCSIEQSIEMIDATAGSDGAKQYLPLAADYIITWDGVAQNNVSDPSGTAYAQALLPVSSGTLIVYPGGTVVPLTPFYQCVALCEGSDVDAPYTDVVSVSASWRSRGEMIMGAVDMPELYLYDDGTTDEVYLLLETGDHLLLE